MARLARILIYPIKSLDGFSVEQAEVLPSGALRGDRRYALRDQEGNFLNGKRELRLHGLRARYDVARQEVTLRYGSEQGSFSLNGRDDRDPLAERESYMVGDRAALSARLSQWLGQAVFVEENGEAGFPDDLESPGPTVVSTASLRNVASWFAGLDEGEVRRRFRANLELEALDGRDLPPFWEDRLCGPPGTEVRFRVGDVVFAGTNPCQRCIVPTRSSITGDPWPLFAKTFAQHRQASLPTWAERSRFDHYYRLAVNTRRVGGGRIIRAGDAVELVT